MSGSTDAAVAVHSRGLWTNWTALGSMIFIVAFAGGAIVRFELHARATSDRQDVLDKSVEKLNDRREETGGTLIKMNAALDGIGKRLDRIENKLDGKH